MRAFHRFLIVFGLLVVAAPCALAGTTVTLVLGSGAMARDFGEAKKRERLVRTVVFRNTGDAPIEIGDVKHTCGGCSPVRLSGHGIAPGGTVKAVLRFDAGRNPGRQVRDIFLPVKQGDASGVLTLRSTWVVRAYLRYKPAEVETGKVVWGEGAREKVTLITRDLEETVRVESVASEWLHLEIAEPMHRPANGDILVRFQVAGDAPVGRFETELAIQTNTKKEPEIRVPVSGEVVGPFACAPAYAHFGVVGKGRRAEKRIDVTLRGRKRYQVELAPPDVDWLAVRLETKDAKTHVLTVSLEPNAPEGKHKMSIRLKTDCPGQPEIEVPILALVRGK